MQNKWLKSANAKRLETVPSYKKHKKFHWENYYIPLTSGMLFTNDLLKKYLSLFWEDKVQKLNNEHILFLCRLQWDNGDFATVGDLQRLNKEDKDYIYNYLLNIISLKSADVYKTIPIISITFSYGFRNGLAPAKQQNKDIQYQTNYHYNFPLTCNLLEYGKLIRQIDNLYIISLYKTNNVLFITKNKNGTENHIDFYKNGELMFKWVDTIINETIFTRKIGKKTYTYVKNLDTNKYELKLLTVKKPAKYFYKLEKDLKIDNKIITMDIETMIIENKHIPYLLSWYDGTNIHSYYLTDYENNIELMISKAIRDLCIRKYKNYKVYIHNFANFDLMFLLKYLAKLGKVQPIIHNGKFISIKFILNKYTIYFKDSYLITHSSIRKLCNSFNLDKDLHKGIFPYIFSKPNNLNYIGQVPDIKYFDKLSLDEYNNYSKNFKNNWNFKNEAIKYCNLDCISLYNIMVKFNNIIFNLFNINFNKYPTIPSISLSIFRINNLKKNSIIQISGKIYKDIKKSYTGGSVDMFIPYFNSNNSNNNLLYNYDVNSLYPYIMLNKPMPIDNCTYFYGDIRKYDKNAFGFFYCKIETPENIEHPIIQIHHKTIDGIRTISPLGNFEYMLFSEEMDNAIKYGYKFEILWGYTFTKGYPFKEFINNLYELRLKYPKTDPMNYISKLLMNSLYGRYGMDYNFNNISIQSKNKADKYINKFIDQIVDIIDLGDNKIIITNNNINNINTQLDNASENHNINIAIASAITSYARIHMTQFKNNKNYNLFYSDTDSIFTDKPLPEDLISNTILGKLKLEMIAKKAIFLAPKVYSLLSINEELKSKVKGLTHDNIKKLNINDFESLLSKDSLLELKQNKWYKNLNESTINIKEQIYTLKLNSNKRQLFYDENNKLTATKPIIINDNKEIK
jgi:hypothetical protein|uniref:DNA polymerase n=1 Tax=Amanita brunnescens TaxID=87326 RepID=A0A5Q0N479_AMABU|nr:DNA polymerase type B [Amanita brunnescens]QFZ98577.1 DNA polymerase type B [Amanita brunnescens]